MSAKIIEALLLLIILLASLVTSTLLSINIFSAVYAQSSFTDQNSINSNDNQSLSNNQSSNLQIQNSQMQQPLSPSTFTNIYKQAINSTVAVAGNNNTQGMGFVYDKFGHIMTTNYIVKGMINSTVHVTFSDGNTFPAKVIGIDQDYDLAVLQLDRQASSQEPLQPLALANSTTVQIGEPVISIGNPFGLSFSISNGIVSGVDKAVPLRNSLLFSTVPNLIQTTGIINPGDAGSPLITLDGKAIGVISSVQTGINGGFSGINFAVSSNTLQKEVLV